MTERERLPLTKTRRFLLKMYSEGLTDAETQQKLNEARKDPNSDIPEWYGDATFKADKDSLLTSGFIKTNATVTTSLGRKELEDDRRRREFRPPSHPPKPTEQVTRPQSSTSRIPSRVQRPAPLPRPIGSQRKEKERLGLSDLGKIKDQFRPE